MIRHLASVRARTTLGTCAIVSGALLLVGVAVIGSLRHSMTEGVDEALAARSGDLAEALSSGLDPSEVRPGDGEDTYTQIVDANGTVLAASPSIARYRPLTDATGLSYRDLPGRIATVEHARVHVRPGPGDLRVIVATTVEGIDDIVGIVTTSLAIGLPLLLAIVGATTWIVVGRTLGPVEAIRAEVSAIGSTGLHRRVPEPTSGDEIGRLARTMNVMLGRLEEANERQERFVSDAAHELRTPIATIRHELEVGLTIHDPDWSSIGQQLLDEDLRMQMLVEDLLWLARNGSRPPPSNRPLIDLDQVAWREERRPRSRAAHCLIDTTGIGPAQVRGVPGDLERLVRNRTDNAHRHFEGRVAVSVADDGTTVTLAVEDDGPGIAIGNRARIFERFTRLEESRTRAAGGTGLGLAIAKDITEDHDGTISVDISPTLGGARSIVVLPGAAERRHARLLGSSQVGARSVVHTDAHEPTDRAPAEPEQRSTPKGHNQ